MINSIRLKTYLGLCFFLISFEVPSASGGQKYPMFSGRVGYFEGAHFDQQVWDAYPLILKAVRSDPISHLSLAQIEEQLLKAASQVPLRSWTVVAPAGRMPLPQVLISESGINGGLDNSFRVGALASEQHQAHMRAYALFTNLLLNDYPQRAFKIFAQQSESSVVTTLDVLTISALIGPFPGGRHLKASPSKADWETLSRSANPCYRFLALEYFDQFPQTPAELLVLYRKCLFEGCSYREGRALTAIIQLKDHREPVAQLLEEYVASNPLMNDGTNSLIRDRFPNRIEASLRIIQLIREDRGKDSNLPLPDRTGSDPTGSDSQREDTPEQNTSISQTAMLDDSASLVWGAIATLIVVAGIALRTQRKKLR
jgi:hypothetical protein